MKKSIAVAALALSMAGGALAQGVQLRGVIGGGITSGGDSIAVVDYYGYYGYYNTAEVRAGGLLAVNAGVEAQFDPVLSAQLLVGYHFDRVNASNGNIKFERYPVELIGHVRANNWFRVGAGLRYSEPKITASGVGLTYVGNESFKGALGTIVEAEFFPVNSFGIKLRYVSEKFESKTYPAAPKVDGSHAGVYFNYYF